MAVKFSFEPRACSECAWQGTETGLETCPRCGNVQVPPAQARYRYHERRAEELREIRKAAFRGAFAAFAGDWALIFIGAALTVALRLLGVL